MKSYGYMYSSNDKIYFTSHITFLSFLYASYLRVYYGMVVTAAVFLCSINYWRYPIHGTRRNIDIVNSVSCCLYQTWKSFYFPNTWLFLVVTYSGVGCYFLSRRTGLGHFHMATHILGNIGNFILYRNTSLSVKQDPVLE